VRTMASLAERGVDPQVVDDQIGRLTFADDIARGIRHLLETTPEPGTYNLTGEGPAMSWADVAREVFRLAGHDPARVTGVTTEDYFANAAGPIAPRPRNSVLATDKITATGFSARGSAEALAEYLLPS